MRNHMTLALFVAAFLGALVVPSMVQARSRTGSDLGTRVAALEAANAAQQTEIDMLRAQPYVTVFNTTFLTEERRLTTDFPLDLIDFGANSDYFLFDLFL